MQVPSDFTAGKHVSVNISWICVSRVILPAETASSQASFTTSCRYARAERTVAFTFAPKLGAIVGTLVRLTWKMPPNSHAWFITQDVPAFVRFEGPLYSGPAWRLDLIGPTLLRDVPLAVTR